MSENYMIENAAYHEAGHTVIAYQLRWWSRYVEIEGVGLGTRDYAALSCNEWDRNLWRVININCAGPLAGYKHDKLGSQFQSDDELGCILHMINTDDLEEDDEEYGDTISSLIFIMKENPNYTDEEVINCFKQHEKECWDMLNESSVWSKVELIAKSLLDRGRLERNEIESLIEI